MCNLYNVTTNQMAIRQFISITHDSIGNMEPSIDVWLDRMELELELEHIPAVRAHGLFHKTVEPKSEKVSC